MCCVLAGVLCQRSFCHMYWGCQRIGCQGCLAPFSGKCLFQQNRLGGASPVGPAPSWGVDCLPAQFGCTCSQHSGLFVFVYCVQAFENPLTHGVQYVSNFRALLWVTVMLTFVMAYFCLVLELNLTDKCLDGALNNNAYETDVLQVKVTLRTPSSCCRTWCKMATRRARSHIFCMFLFFHQNYLSSRGKSWKDLRQEALQNVEQGKYYPAGNPTRPHMWMIHMQHKWKNWVSAVLPLNQSNKSVCQTVTSLEVPSCARTAACELWGTLLTNTDRTSLHPNCQVKQNRCIFIQLLKPRH